MKWARGAGPAISLKKISKYGGAESYKYMEWARGAGSAATVEG